MKYRSGFVSNSSSSSFICVVCGEDYSGWDACLSDAEMIECVNGHVVCLGHLKDSSSIDDPYDVSEEYCPVCNLEILPDEYLASYFLKKYNLKREDVVSEIKREFKTYENFAKYLEG